MIPKHRDEPTVKDPANCQDGKTQSIEAGSSIRTFPNRVEPKSAESLYSYLFRIAQVNYYEHLASMVEGDYHSLLYVENQNYFDADSPLQLEMESNCRMLMVDKDPLVLNQFNNILFGGEPNFSNQRQHFNKMNARYCPICMQEDFYHRIHWDLSMLTVCTKHKIYLVEKCSACDRQIPLSNLMQDTCKCDASFSKVAGEQVTDPYLLVAQQALYEMLVEGRQEIPAFNGEKMLSSREYFELFDSFGGLLDRFDGTDPAFSRLSVKVEEVNFLLRTKVERGREMNSLLTATIHQLITNPIDLLPGVFATVDEMMNRSKWSFNTKRPYRNKILSHPIGGEEYQEAYQQFLRKVNTGYLKQKLCNVEPPTDSMYLNISETMKFLHCEFNVVMRLCDMGVLKTHRAARPNGELILIERASAEEFKKKKEESMSVSEVMKKLGANFYLVKKLHHIGILRSFHGPQLGEYGTWMFDPKSVESLFSAISQNPVGGKPDPSEWITFKKATFAFLVFDFGGAEILQNVMEGKWNGCVLKSRLNLEGFYLLKREIEDFKQTLINKRIQEKGYRIKEIAALLHIGPPKVWELIHTGRLQVTAQETNANGTISSLVSAEQVGRLL